jgi:hypothetical protein
MEVVCEVYIHEMEVLHDSCRECSKVLPRVCWSMHVSDHVTDSVREDAGTETMEEDKWQDIGDRRYIRSHPRISLVTSLHCPTRNLPKI